MTKSNFLNKNWLPIISLAVLLLVIAYFKFQSSPPNFRRVFSRHRPAEITFEYPDDIAVSQPFKISVKLNTNNQKVNAVGVYLKFNPNQIKLQDLDTSQSFCQFYPEKRFDNYIGTISLSCGSPHPGVSGQDTLMVLSFTPLFPGTTTILLDPQSKVLLSDGQGTNILSDFPVAQINILTDL